MEERLVMSAKERRRKVEFEGVRKGRIETVAHFRLTLPKNSFISPFSLNDFGNTPSILDPSVTPVS